MTSGRTCEHCRWWGGERTEIGSRVYGTCRRYAPRGEGWSLTHCDCWCGEWERTLPTSSKPIPTPPDDVDQYRRPLK